MQPVVILGGFLITDEAYGPMANWLKQQGDLDVSVVHASRIDWLLTSSAWGWQRLLQRVEGPVIITVRHRLSRQVTATLQ